MTKQVYILIIVVVVISGILIALNINANRKKAEAQLAALQTQPKQLDWVNLLNGVIGGVVAGVSSNSTKG